MKIKIFMMITVAAIWLFIFFMKYRQKNIILSVSLLFAISTASYFATVYSMKKPHDIYLFINFLIFFMSMDYIMGLIRENKKK